MSFYFPSTSLSPLPHDASTAWPAPTDTLPAPKSPFMHMWSSPSFAPKQAQRAPAAPPVLTLEPPADPSPRRLRALTTSNAARALRDVQNYKTMLCKSLARNEVCGYETRCRFAHGVHELRLRPVSAVFKTEPCDSYTKSGACGYERHCSFLHDDILVRVGQHDYWWVSASDTIIHVEKVSPENLQRITALRTRMNWQGQHANAVANRINQKFAARCSNTPDAEITASRPHPDAHGAAEIFLAQLSQKDARNDVLGAAFKTLNMVVECIAVGAGPGAFPTWPKLKPTA